VKFLFALTMKKAMLRNRIRISAAKHKSKSRNKDLDIINLNADYLNSEASDVLNYQALK